MTNVIYLVSFVCCSHVSLSQINDIDADRHRQHSPSRSFLWPPYTVCFQYLCCLKSPVISRGCSSDASWQVTHVTQEDGWLAMMLRPWHNKFKNKASATQRDTHTHTRSPLVAAYFLRWHLLRFVWVHCSVTLSDMFQPGERDTNSIWKQWFDKFETQIQQNLFWFTLIRSVADSEGCLFWENRMEPLGSFTTKPKYCHCVCARMPLSVHVCSIVCSPVCHLCPQRGILACPSPSRRPCTSISSFWCRHPVDWQGTKRTNDATTLHRDSQIQFHFSTSLTSDCLLVGSDPRRAVCHSCKHFQACRTTNAPKEFHRLRGFVLLLMMPILESLVGVYSHCLLMPLPWTIPSHQTASDGWLN